MSEQLVIFWMDFDVPLERVCEALQQIFHEAHLDAAELQPIPGPEGLSEAGWRAVRVSDRTGIEAGAALALRDNLGQLTKAFSRALDGVAVGLFIDSSAGLARAWLQQPSGHPHSSDGEAYHVIRQAAAWIDADPNALARYFSAYAPKKSELTGPLDLTLVPSAPFGPADEDDQFVEAKLKAAREWMERYLATRK